MKNQEFLKPRNSRRKGKVIHMRLGYSVSSTKSEMQFKMKYNMYV